MRGLLGSEQLDKGAGLMTEHHVYVNHVWHESPHDLTYRVRCECGYREDALTKDHAMLLAVKHKREPRHA